MNRKLFSRLNARRAAAAVSTAMMLTALGLVGCNSSAGTAGAMLSEPVGAQTVSAVVESVDGDAVTVLLVDEDEIQAYQEQMQEFAAMPDGSLGDPATMMDRSEAAAQPEGNEPPEKPEGEEPPAMPEGEAPAGGQGDQPDANASEPPAKPDEGAVDAAGAEGVDASAQDATEQDGKEGDKPVAPSDEGSSLNGTEATLTITDESLIVTTEGDGESAAGLEIIDEGCVLTLTVDEDGTTVTKIEVESDMGANASGQGGPAGEAGEPPAKPDGEQGGPGGASAEPNSGTGATTFAEDAEESGATYDSSESDVSAIMANGGATVSLADATVTKTGDSSSNEDSDFYGLNAGIVVTDAANLTLSGGSVTTDAKGGNGVFAYGEGTQVTVSDMEIVTSQGNSGGIEVAGGAALTASNLTIDTQGQSSAAIRSDRGGGTETVVGGSYTTHGTSSPAVYCTADVTVRDATLLAENCEAVVIEGFNNVTLANDDVTGNVNGEATRTGVVPNVMIYQSMSGDAEEGTGTFTMQGGSFTATNGTLFYVTNTSAVIELSDVDLQIADDLLIAGGNDGQWGKEGSNGATVDLTATDQALTGNITVDEISSLALKLVGSSTYVGAVNAAGQAGDVTIDVAEGATWTLTADSYVSSLTGDTAGVDLNGYTLYVDGQAWSA